MPDGLLQGGILLWKCRSDTELSKCYILSLDEVHLSNKTKEQLMSDAQRSGKYFSIPAYLLLFVVLSALLVPFAGRLTIAMVSGWTFFDAYWEMVSQKLLVFSALNLIPAFWWFLAGKLSRRLPHIFWISYGAGMVFLFVAHGTVDLQGSSTAALGLLFYPLYGLGISIISWFIAWIIHHFGFSW